MAVPIAMGVPIAVAVPTSVGKAVLAGIHAHIHAYIHVHCDHGATMETDASSARRDQFPAISPAEAEIKLRSGASTNNKKQPEIVFRDFS